MWYFIMCCWILFDNILRLINILFDNILRIMSPSVVSNSFRHHGLYVARQAPLSMGILRARFSGQDSPEWVAMPSSRESSQPKDQTKVSHNSGGFFTI